MAELFSSYLRPQQALGPWRARAALVLPPGLACLFLVGVTPAFYSELIVLEGAILWALSMLGAFLLPNRITLSVAILGSMLVGAGIVATTGEHCGPRYSIDDLMRPSSGKPKSSSWDFAIIEC